MRFSAPKRGEMHPLARLSADQAAKMRQQLNTGRSLRDLGNEYGVSPSTVRKVRDRISHNEDKSY